MSLKKLVKGFLPTPVAQLLGRLLYRNYENFYWNRTPTPYVSDFFLYRKKGYETQFVLENTISLLTDTPISCDHKLTFFDRTGNLCGELSHSSIEKHVSLKVLEADGQLDDYGGFVHSTNYKSINKAQQIEIEKIGLPRQHRGYAGYRYLKQNNQDAFSIVHGNFGALSLDKHGKIIHQAAIRKPFCYVPQYIFGDNYKYELCFLNHASKTIEVAIYGMVPTENDIKLADFEIPSMGAHIFEFSPSNLPTMGKSNCIYWVSKLPTFRAICFEHSLSSSPQIFNSFHT